MKQKYWTDFGLVKCQTCKRKTKADWKWTRIDPELVEKRNLRCSHCGDRPRPIMGPDNYPGNDYPI